RGGRTRGVGCWGVRRRVGGLVSRRGRRGRTRDVGPQGVCVVGAAVTPLHEQGATGCQDDDRQPRGPEHSLHSSPQGIAWIRITSFSRGDRPPAGRRFRRPAGSIGYLPLPLDLPAGWLGSFPWSLPKWKPAGAGFAWSLPTGGAW